MSEFPKMSNSGIKYIMGTEQTWSTDACDMQFKAEKMKKANKWIFKMDDGWIFNSWNVLNCIVIVYWYEPSQRKDKTLNSYRNDD